MKASGRWVGLIFLGLVCLAVAVPAVLTWRQIRQERLNRALVEAAKRNDEKAVVSVLKLGADANCRDEPASRVSLWKAMFHALNGRSTGSKAPTVLMVAVSRLMDSHWRENGVPVMMPASENLPVVQTLVKYGADVNAVCGSPVGSILMDGSILTHAIDYKYGATAHFLIGRGADVNSKDFEGTTPLMTSAYNDQADVTQDLLDHGAQLNARDSDGRTALMYAADGDAETTLKLLLNQGAMSQLRDSTGWSVLMHAASQANMGGKTVKYLLAQRITGDLSVRDKYGRTVRAIAEQGGASPSIIRLLKATGDKP